jgi:hypothetical protein
MNDAIQNPEAQKLAQMLQQQQMQKILQSISAPAMGSAAMSNADMQNMTRAQPDYGMNVGSAPMPSSMQQQGDFMQPSVQMGQPMPNSMGSMAAKPTPMPSVRGDGYMSNYEMMRKR